MTLRQLWNRIVGEPKEDPLIRVLEALTENQRQTTESVMKAVNTIGEASAKQAEVLNSYLRLFNTPGEPQTWQYDPHAENETQLQAAGFPKDGDEADQAKWILDNLDKL